MATSRWLDVELSLPEGLGMGHQGEKGQPKQWKLWPEAVDRISQSLDAPLNEGYEIFEETWPKSENKEKGSYKS